MNDIDERLREYAPQWRAAQPPPPPLHPMAHRAVAAGPARTRRWLPAIAVAAAVLLVAAGLGIARYRTNSAPAPVGSVTPTPVLLPNGVVPFTARPPGNVTIPTIAVPASPDPALATPLPPCRASSLSAQTTPDGAGGTRFLEVELRANTACRLEGYPAVTPLDAGGRAVAVPTEKLTRGGEYNAPVAVGPDTHVALTLGWLDEWCAKAVTVAKLRLTLPAGAGSLTVAGFGPSICSAAGAPTRPPIQVGQFQPMEFTPDHTVSALSGTYATLSAPASAAAGGTLRLQVALVAPAGPGVPLAACPDYRITLGTAGAATEVRYQLNCAAVPYRDAAGQPYLPAGVPVRFEMEIAVPATITGDAKLTWGLVDTDTRGDATMIQIG